ncbi:unnamed protein product [Symbiodinium necroappetens]|uniref:Uncharacterized protein n=1 Tax=Symbiodinium necroappetens TaxID=1628268 RepID=A0A812Q0U4_9DINO|nr:unnamed protein product [Symbiodinium necroappetens]
MTASRVKNAKVFGVMSARMSDQTKPKSHVSCAQTLAKVTAISVSTKEELNIASARVPTAGTAVVDVTLSTVRNAVLACATAVVVTTSAGMRMTEDAACRSLWSPALWHSCWFHLLGRQLCLFRRAGHHVTCPSLKRQSLFVLLECAGILSLVAAGPFRVNSELVLSPARLHYHATSSCLV